MLLENKKTQQKTLTTLLTLLRQDHFEADKSFLEVKKNDQTKNWNLKQISINKELKYLKTKLLFIIYNTFKNSPFKIDGFLKEKLQYEGYFKKKLPRNGNLDQSEESYNPLLELLDLSLDSNFGLAVEIIHYISE